MWVFELLFFLSLFIDFSVFVCELKRKSFCKGGRGRLVVFHSESENFLLDVGNLDTQYMHMDMEL